MGEPTPCHPVAKKRVNIQEDTSSGAAGGAGRVSLPFGARARASMILPAPVRPSTPDDLQVALRSPASFGVKLFEVNVLLPVFNACRPVKDAGEPSHPSGNPLGGTGPSVHVPD